MSAPPCPKCGKLLDKIIERTYIIHGDILIKTPWVDAKGGFDPDEADTNEEEFDNIELGDRIRLECPHCGKDIDEYFGEGNPPDHLNEDEQDDWEEDYVVRPYSREKIETEAMEHLL